MTEKTEKKWVFVTLNGKEYNVDERLPDSFLESKLKESQKYIPIHIYRDILRQLPDLFWVPTFTDPEKIISGKNKSGVEVIAFRVKCSIERLRHGEKKPVVLVWDWYSAISWGAMLSDAIHGNIATLQAKALRSALKLWLRIFEYPEADLPEPTAQDVELTTPAKATDDVMAKMPTVNAEDIEKEYKRLFSELSQKCLETKVTIKKPMILAIATQLKVQFGEENKPTILKLITDSLNLAE